MLLVKAPFRISFVGGGTDLPAFYQQERGAVISSTIDKFVYVAINPTPMTRRFVIKHRSIESADDVDSIVHPYLRASLKDVGVDASGLDISVVSDLPGRTGLGGSSSFTVALLKGLNALCGRQLSRPELAQAACRLEIELLGEPIGKQDQHAAAIGGLNVFYFNRDGSVTTEPVFLHFEKRARLEAHSMLLYTGITRGASEVLREQQQKTSERIEVYRRMAASVLPFRDALLAGDVRTMAEMLHRGWEDKKQLGVQVSNPAIDELYEAARRAGAWGGKLLGAGRGGCIYLLAPPELHPAIAEAVHAVAARHGLADLNSADIRFVQSGADIVFNDRRR
jgi:D-glycero-alpha-D-manno-heptose-7-phosphate kinase